MDAGSWWPDGDLGEGRIPLAALEHADYCLRQAALIHVDGVFIDDNRTVSGTLAHRNVHELKYPLPRSEAAARLVTGVPVWSNRLGLYGICDAVEMSASSVLPIEHKIGPYHPGGPPTCKPQPRPSAWQRCSISTCPLLACSRTPTGAGTVLKSRRR